jgi:hypothetical protein
MRLMVAAVTAWMALGMSVDLIEVSDSLAEVSTDLGSK